MRLKYFGALLVGSFDGDVNRQAQANSLTSLLN
jgi:hypothetical protein